ncbi:YccS family putative transporter [Psychromonas aquimarina]|uniref:YccS family putative transporter n=1 Tax=Psychromonas aquimarina TaxID=444919 RepID=UPI00041DFF2E|nr:YccS family putative transporter [Psychromonas aquimarina]
MKTSRSLSSFKNIARKLVSDSNVHSGLRVLIAMSITFIPVLNYNLLPFFEQSSLQMSISLCLGVMASAIVETDDNYKNRRKFILTIVICFFIASASVELLMPYPILFGLGLLTSSFVFMMLAALGTHYSKVGFGAILVAIYTMIGHQSGINWYEQPLLLSLGALWYGLFSIIWNFYSPYRSLREQLAQLFFSLSRYQQQKSALFNEIEGTSREGIFSVRQQLAVQNIAIMARLDQSKRIIQSRFQVCQQQSELNKLNYYYFVAEQIHERISASQYLYSQLEITFGKSQILEGYHQLFLQLSEEYYQLGAAVNDKKPYQHSRRLKWTFNALADQLYLLKQQPEFDNNNEAMQALQAIYDNIRGIDHLLLSLCSYDPVEQAESPVISVEQQGQPTQSIFKTLIQSMKATNPVFKHAVRISTSLLVAFALQQSFQLAHGFWILLTVLFVCQPSFSETRKRLILRSLGTLAGILLGYPILMLVGGSFSQIVLLILTAFFFFSYLRTNYGLAVVFITLFVMFIFNLLTGSGMEILPARIGETLLGCLLSVLAISFIFPDWQFQRFPSLVNQLLNLSGRYFKQVSQQYQYGRSENLNYRETRFQTFQSDALLTSAWQSMLFEPSSKQKLNREVYALVNRCDALVSYIAALASHRHKMQGFENNQALQHLICATEKQIALAYNQQQTDKIQPVITVDEFEKYKPMLSSEVLLIVEQLRLIAFTALDIQVLLQQVDFNHKTER